MLTKICQNLIKILSILSKFCQYFVKILSISENFIFHHDSFVIAGEGHRFPLQVVDVVTTRFSPGGFVIRSPARALLPLASMGRTAYARSVAARRAQNRASPQTEASPLAPPQTPVYTSLRGSVQ